MSAADSIARVPLPRARRARTLLLAALGLALASPVRADDWWGRDKALHFSVTFTLGGGGYYVAGFAFDEPHYRALAGGGLALVVGAGKELADATGSGDASARDMTWNAIGAAAGVLVGWGIDRLLLRPTPRTTAAAGEPAPSEGALPAEALPCCP